MKLKPLYAELLELVKNHKEKLCAFFCQTGKEWDKSKHRILFVGRATNGWVTFDRDVDHLFDLNNEYRIVNRDDEIEWVEKPYTSKDAKYKYNSKKSAFWRVVRSISLDKEGSQWYKYISWTNLYKLAPQKGNPSKSIREQTIECCDEILDKEIELLKPKNVVFLTFNMEQHYLNHIGFKDEQIDKTIPWGKYKSFSFHHNGTNFIVSYHPQAKPEEMHKTAIIGLIGSMP